MRNIDSFGYHLQHVQLCLVASANSEESFSSVQDLSQPTLNSNNIDFTAQETSLNSWDDEITDSPNTSAAFEEASMIMTLAEKFSITKFRDYQKKIIKALCAGSDCLVIQPTGSGKSLCFQFPAVYMNKIAIVITPTISLMQDHVKNCEQYGIKAIFLGSAQLDRQKEDHVLSGKSDANIVLVTPVIALDEAHLFHYWQEFRAAYKNLEILKDVFPSIPLLCLTATAPPPVENSISQQLLLKVALTGQMSLLHVKKCHVWEKRISLILHHGLQSYYRIQNVL